MNTKNWLQRASSMFLMMAIMLSVIQPGWVDTAFAAQAITDENVIYDPATGALAFVGTPPGGAATSLLANPLAGPPAVNATAFASTFGKQLGLNDVSNELAVAKTFTDVDGRSTVRYQQNYQGVPVFGGEVIVNTDARGAMLSLTAKTSPNLNLDIHPVLTADAAALAAAQAIAEENQINRRLLKTGAAKLQIYDSRLLNPDDHAPRLVWNVTVYDLADGINALVLVDAHTGEIALHYNQMDVIDSAALGGTASADSTPEVLGAPQIGIYNLHHTTPVVGSPTGWPGTFICNQGNKTACDGVGGDDVDATKAYLNALDAYNFMKNYLKIDSFNNAGAPTIGSIHYDTGYKRVSWITGSHTAYYGDSYAGADDMAGHAIGFGLLEYSAASALVLAYQPGAIAESLSDMWGEFIDQTNARGTDTAAVKWIIGEDWPAGKQRNMSNPSASPYLDADRMLSPNYYLGDDNGVGVYTNAGVNNKAVYLMTNGGTFNGKTVTALGIAKVARIYYEAESHLLASASTYFDLYYAVKQACYNMVAASKGVFAQDCDQVRNALDAVQMNLTRAPGTYPVAKFCPANTSKGNAGIFFDSFEAGTAKWKMTNQTNPTYLWKAAIDSATAGKYHLEGPEPDVPSLAIAEMLNPVLIPSGHGVYLFFEHSYRFDTLGTNYYDGGALHYSIDNGATWKSAAPLFFSGKNYGGAIATGLGNPIQGQQAFVDFVRGYVSTSYNLTSLAGKQVKFRWIMASNNSGSGLGWYIDNVQIYPCVALPGVPVLVAPALNALQTTYTPTLDWSNSTPDLHHYVVQVANDTAFKSIVYQATTTASLHKLAKALAPNRRYYWRVRAYNAANDAKGWSAVRYFRTALAPPVLQSPITGTTGSVRPIFNWTDVAGATGYAIQVSTVASFTSLTLNVTIPTATSTYQPATNLASARTYYWRVRTNGANGPGAWSLVKSFKTP